MESLGVGAHIAHQDALESAQVAVDGLADADNLIVVGKMVA